MRSRVGFFLLLLMILSSCAGKSDMTIREPKAGQFSISFASEGALSSVMMSYFEDLDVMMGVAPREDGLPSAFDEALAFLLPYVQNQQLRRLAGNRLSYRFAINDLARFQQEFSEAGFKAIQFYQENQTYRLRLAMSEVELELFYASMSILPKVPSQWSASSRSAYIQQLANIFGATQNERNRLAQELERATMTFTLTLPKNAKNASLQTSKGSTVIKNQRIEQELSVIDFLAGKEWLEMTWQ
ncbi:hypothetical protein [Entomospira culicis]|uniref:Uncharacterized protein n=1 Tax=Entomospira culicis TaxID=2719989 RepID=A0A968GIT0_9SPIO|nr:hypothetical protein [Entomospira culicis]NIZ18419.1 hypothetical protein [Entomospira culicis]NIZ68635.1 hypothetical protein [Entomospira culicis]WDI37235.1 hypothetical protein PVA46_00145 [Entomospira culicis]WDI38863.1 hypothetical protein PVA47_00155 [Entomospira culicis]